MNDLEKRNIIDLLTADYKVLREKENALNNNMRRAKDEIFAIKKDKTRTAKDRYDEIDEIVCCIMKDASLELQNLVEAAKNNFNANILELSKHYMIFDKTFGLNFNVQFKTPMRDNGILSTMTTYLATRFCKLDYSLYTILGNEDALGSIISSWKEPKDDAELEEFESHVPANCMDGYLLLIYKNGNINHLELGYAKYSDFREMEKGKQKHYYPDYKYFKTKEAVSEYLDKNNLRSFDKLFDKPLTAYTKTNLEKLP